MPISALDGFAELSGESANASLQSLTSLAHSPAPRSPDTWSSIVSAMPMPARKPTGLRQQDTLKTIRSQGSIAEPVNASHASSKRQSREVKPQSSVPQLAEPDFGPSIRASQLDLTAEYQIRSPKHKQSSFSEPADLLNSASTAYARRTMRGRGLFGFHRKKAPSIRSFTFSPPPSRVDQDWTYSQHCRVERPVSYFDRPSLPETIAMSEFAYRKHKLMEKLREWCRRRCVQARPYILKPKKRRSVPPGGFIV